MAGEKKYYCFCGANCKYETLTKEQILTAIEQAVSTGEIKDVNSGFVTTLKTMNRNVGLRFWVGTTAEYNAIQNKELNVLYIKTDDTSAEDISSAIDSLLSRLSAAESTLAQVYGAPTIRIPSTDDLNNYIEAGTFYAYTNSVPAHSPPTTRTYRLTVEVIYGTVVIQTATTVANTVYTRVYANNVWSEWKNNTAVMKVGTITVGAQGATTETTLDDAYNAVVLSANAQITITADDIEYIQDTGEPIVYKPTSAILSISSSTLRVCELAVGNGSAQFTLNSSGNKITNVSSVRTGGTVQYIAFKQ